MFKDKNDFHYKYNEKTMPSHKHKTNKVSNYLNNTNELSLEPIRYGEINAVKKLLKLGYTQMSYSTGPITGTNYSLYQYMMGSTKHSKRQRLKMYYLLISYGLDTKNHGENYIKIWNELFVKNCFNICVALLELPALQTVAICQATHPYSVVIPFYMFWNMVTIVKHFNKNKNINGFF